MASKRLNDRLDRMEHNCGVLIRGAQYGIDLARFEKRHPKEIAGRVGVLEARQRDLERIQVIRMLARNGASDRKLARSVTEGLKLNYGGPYR